MDKILGKFFIIIFFLCASFVHGKIQMRALTAEGQSLETAAMGQPFIIEVTVDGVQGSVSAPVIDGISGFVVKRTGTYMSSINGISTTKFSYHVRIDEPGVYALGPARIKQHNQQELVSDEISVRVGKNAVSTSQPDKGKKSQKQEQAKVFLRLYVDKDTVVMGQKIPCTLRFFYQDPTITLAHIGQPELTGFDMKKIDSPAGGSMEVGGTQYRYAEWKWDMYPKVAGEYMIPAYSADYELPADDKRLHSGLFMFFNVARTERKRIYSNAVKIRVAPLPHYDGHVDAIGSFESMVATIKPPMAKAGEGMVFALEIEGDGNWGSLVAPPLSMPKELKYYDSCSFDPVQLAAKQSQKDGQVSKKRFEFIVQGLKAGDWEIPPQSFTFFDIEKKMYKTLHSSSLLVTITPNNVALSVENNDDLLHASEMVDTEVNSDIQPLNVQGPWYPVSERSPLPLIIMQIAMLLPLAWSAFFVMRDKVFILGNTTRMRKRRAFKRAKKAIEVCSQHGDAKALYQIFMQLFADYYQQSYGDVSEAINSIMHADTGGTTGIAEEWDGFFVAITQAAFGIEKNNNGYSLCKAAQQWIDCLEKIV